MQFPPHARNPAEEEEGEEEWEEGEAEVIICERYHIHREHVVHDPELQRIPIL